MKTNDLKITLKRKFNLKNELINKKIYIRDIYVLHPDRNDSTGEKNRTKFPESSTAFERLSLYVQLLAKVAGHFHKIYFGDRHDDEVTSSLEKKII